MSEEYRVLKSAKIRKDLQSNKIITAHIIDDTRIGDAAWSSKNIVDKLCPTFTESGTIVTCEPVEGYPLEVTAEDGATITRCGKNLFDISKIKTDSITEDKYPTNTEIVEVTDNSFTIRSHPGYTGNGWKNLNVTLGELCPSLRVGDTFTISANTDASMKYMWLANASVAIYYGKSYVATKEMLASKPTIYGYDTKQGTGDCVTSNLQVEFDNTVTAFELYKEAETFTPGETIPALPGTNVIFADAGLVTVTGKADPTAIINKLTNAILSLGGNV